MYSAQPGRAQKEADGPRRAFFFLFSFPNRGTGLQLAICTTPPVSPHPNIPCSPLSITESTFCICPCVFTVFSAPPTSYSSSHPTTLESWLQPQDQASLGGLGHWGWTTYLAVNFLALVTISFSSLGFFRKVPMQDHVA